MYVSDFLEQSSRINWDWFFVVFACIVIATTIGLLVFGLCADPKEVLEEIITEPVATLVLLIVVFVAASWLYVSGGFSSTNALTAHKVISKNYTLEHKFTDFLPRQQDSVYLTTDGNELRLDVSDKKVRFKDEKGKFVDASLYERLKEDDLVNLAKKRTVMHNIQVQGPDDEGDTRLPSIDELEDSSLNDSGLSILGTVDDQLIKIAVTAEDGELKMLVNDGLPAKKVFR